MFNISKKKGEDAKLEENEEIKEIDLEIHSPPPEVVKPKIRAIIRPSRPNTSAIIQQPEVFNIVKANGKMSRRLRSFVNDHRDIPM